MKKHSRFSYEMGKIFTLHLLICYHKEDKNATEKESKRENNPEEKRVENVEKQKKRTSV